MNIEVRLTKILSATPSQLEKIDDVLENRTASAESVNTKLLTFSNAATLLGVSRQTLWRMCNDNKIPTVEIRTGSRRVPAAALTALVKRAEFKGGQA
ncbi:MAG: helix-turn-helix domain-containing protein [bacterium]